MKKWSIIIVCALVVIAASIRKSHTFTQSNLDTPHKDAPTPVKNTSSPLSEGIIIPYWSTSFEGANSRYDTYYYFGVAPNQKGGIVNDAGLKNIPIMDTVPGKQKKLVVRMLENSVNDVLFTEKNAQNVFLQEIKEILVHNSFSGLLLDIEVPFTLQAERTAQITKFVQLICTSVKADYKTCGVLLYGDYSYRNRPYDVKALGGIVDTVSLMAYDLHKAGGEPGPNFNFDDKKIYGYDFKSMIQETLSFVPQDKIEVIFGMYGYDWTLNDQGTPLKTARALSLGEIRAFASSQSGLTFSSNSAKEKKIEYKDEEGRKHVIWYEDEESARVKTTYLFEQGIHRVSFWAQSYF